MNRDRSVDFLRGCAMILMTLDHVRFYFSSPFINPLDLSKTSASLFLTRWVTHFCAPVFVFLAGLGIALSLMKTKNKKELSKFLITRGLILVVLEMTLLLWVWDFSFDYTTAPTAMVIWAIGWSMICLAGLIHLPKALIGAFAMFLIFGHNSVDGFTMNAGKDSLAALWIILHQGGSFQLTSNFKISVLYPLIPWIGVMALGYVCGSYYELSESERRQQFKRIGLSSILLFIFLRYLNVYGDASPWTPQSTSLFTFLSFINCSKYPPSLLFLLMTLGPLFLLLGTLSLKNSNSFALNSITTLGKVPMFFYIIHIPIIHLICLAFASINYQRIDFLFDMVKSFKERVPENYFYSLSSIYVVWLLCVGLLIYPCIWFAKIKGRGKHVWLRYL